MMGLSCIKMDNKEPNKPQSTGVQVLEVALLMAYAGVMMFVVTLAIAKQHSN